LGHLRRISRIAAALGRDFANLIVTGIPDAQWLIPAGCELLKLPNWDNISAERSQCHGRHSWLGLSHEDAASFRRQLIRSAGEAFKPHAILVDYLPFGMGDELRPLLGGTTARKYLIHRGISEHGQSFLGGAATRAIADSYNRIIVTADPRISDVAKEYEFVEAAARKIVYAGYIRPDACARDDGHGTGLHSGRPLIVCSCGSGHRGEQLLSACVRAAQVLGDYDFEVVLGPHGSLQPGSNSSVTRNCRLTRVHHNLTAMHQAATVVITHGGYNSVLEAVSGGARILVFHLQEGPRDERVCFERRLGPHYPIRPVVTLEHLVDDIKAEVERALAGGKVAFDLNFDGLASVVNIIREDLGMVAAAYSTTSVS
jgi:predicted glycosyltransferase